MNIAVVFAGGVGARMRSRDLPKQFLEIHGKPIIVHTLKLFEKHDEIDAVVVACIEGWISHLEGLVQANGLTKVKKVVAGGVTGQDSIFNGLLAAKEVAGNEQSVVLIHDGVRPLIDAKTISDNIASVKASGSAITCVKAKETVLEVSGDNRISRVPSREEVRLAKAPQSFWLEDLLAAHAWAQGNGESNYIDSASLMRDFGKDLYLVEGPEENIKITTPSDFFAMRAILDARENEQLYGGERNA